MPYGSIKPFRLGDVSGNDDGLASADQVLLASVAAAEAALRAAGAHQSPHSKSYEVLDGYEGADSDSDGGWGASREVSGRMKIRV